MFVHIQTQRIKQTKLLLYKQNNYIHLIGNEAESGVAITTLHDLGDDRKFSSVCVDDLVDGVHLV
jgi:phosphoserine aminotransferase